MAAHLEIIKALRAKMPKRVHLMFATFSVCSAKYAKTDSGTRKPLPVPECHICLGYGTGILNRGCDLEIHNAGICQMNSDFAGFAVTATVPDCHPATRIKHQRNALARFKPLGLNQPGCLPSALGCQIL